MTLATVPSQPFPIPSIADYSDEGHRGKTCPYAGYGVRLMISDLQPQ